jgi:hypothetical protein
LYSSRVRRWHAQAGLRASCATGCSWVSHKSYWQQLISHYEYVIGSSQLPSRASIYRVFSPIQDPNIDSLSSMCALHMHGWLRSWRWLWC